MNGEQPFWESAYGDPAAETFGPASEEVVEIAAALPRGAYALDLGCGDGRNALCLAERGLHVDAFDVSAAGIQKVLSRARAADVPVRAWVQQIETFSFEREYDLVVAHGVLHLLERDVWLQVLDAVRRHTRPGGWNIVVVFTDRLPAPPDLAPYMRGLFREGELFDCYRDWLLHRREAYTLNDEHPRGVHHQHPVNKIVAQKPEP
jgi:tellurite methyltransferase